MLLRQIQFFVSIVDENSFTEAAAKNYVSQSAVSQALNALEADLGVKLIERKNRSCQMRSRSFRRFIRRFISPCREVPGEDGSTEWCEPVSDEDYNRL